MLTASFHRWLDPAFSALLGIAFTTAAAIAAGRNLGMTIGGLFSAAVVVPMMAGGSNGIRRRIILALSLTAGVAIVWLTLIGSSAATVNEWVGITFVLAAFSVAVAGLEFFLSKLTPSRSIVGQALTVVFALAWLSWPLWGNGVAAAWIVPIHPPLVLNGILVFTQPWTEQTIAYHLTNLDQDVPIRLAATPLPCVLTHLAAATVFFTAGYGVCRLLAGTRSGAKTRAAKGVDIGPM